MANRYSVKLTFSAPGVRVPFESSRRLPGRGGSMRWVGSQGCLTVSASRVSAENPPEAVMLVVGSVQARWAKSRGRLTLRSWSAGRERVLFGARRGTTATMRVLPWNGDGDGDGDDGGSAGVREPRRPLPGPGSLYAAQELPGARF